MAAPSAAELAQLPFFEAACQGLRSEPPVSTDVLASMFQTDPLLISAIQAEFVKPRSDEASTSKPKGTSYAAVAAAAADLPDAPKPSPSPAAGKAAVVSPPVSRTPSLSGDESTGEGAPFKIPKRPIKGSAAKPAAAKSRGAIAAAVKSQSRRLSEEERVKRLANGQCFYCGHDSHTIADCLKLKAKNLKNKGKLPLKPTPAEIEEAISMEASPSYDVNATRFRPDQSDSE